MRVWNVRAWAGRAAPSSRTSGKRNKQGTPKTGLQDKKSAHGRETLAPRTKTQLRPVRTVPDPFAPRAVLLQQNQSQLRPVGVPAPGANACPPLSHRGRCSYKQNQSQLRPVGAPAPGANAYPPVRTEAGAPTGSSTTKPHPNADNPPPTPPTPP